LSPAKIPPDPELHIDPAEVRAILDRLQWSPRILADVLNTDPRAARRWFAGSHFVPPPVADWLRALDRFASAMRPRRQLLPGDAAFDDWMSRHPRPSTFFRA
jgi:hypothetical protein